MEDSTGFKNLEEQVKKQDTQIEMILDAVRSWRREIRENNRKIESFMALMDAQMQAIAAMMKTDMGCFRGLEEIPSLLSIPESRDPLLVLSQEPEDDEEGNSLDTLENIDVDKPMASNDDDGVRLVKLNGKTGDSLNVIDLQSGLEEKDQVNTHCFEPKINSGYVCEMGHNYRIDIRMYRGLVLDFLHYDFYEVGKVGLLKDCNDWELIERKTHQAKKMHKSWTKVVTGFKGGTVCRKIYQNSAASEENCRLYMLNFLLGTNDVEGAWSLNVVVCSWDFKFSSFDSCTSHQYDINKDHSLWLTCDYQLLEESIPSVFAQISSTSYKMEWTLKDFGDFETLTYSENGKVVASKYRGWDLNKIFDIQVKSIDKSWVEEVTGFRGGTVSKFVTMESQVDKITQFKRFQKPWTETVILFRGGIISQYMTSFVLCMRACESSEILLCLVKECVHMTIHVERAGNNASLAILTNH